MLVIFYMIVNILAFLLMGLDKYKAIHQHYRISEKALLLMIWLGGMLGSGLAMFIFHHKIRKKIFIISVFISFILHFTILYYITLQFGFII